MKTPEEVKKNKRKKNIIALSILVLGTIAAFLIFGQKKEAIQDAQEIQSPAALVGAIILSQEDSKIAEIEKTASWSAGDESAKAISEYSGRIKNVYFEIGKQVTRGQTLAVFDQSKLENPPKVSFDSAKESFELAEKNLSKIEDLNDENIKLTERSTRAAKLTSDNVKNDATSTDEEKDLADENVKISEVREEQARRSAEIQENSAEIQLEQARLSLEQARAAYENTIIKSPITGTIVSKNISEEDFLSPGDTVAEIVGVGKIEAIIFLNKDEIERIKAEDKVQIKIGDKKYPGKILSYSKIANDSNERFEVKIVSDDCLPEESNRTGSVILNAYLKSDKGFFVPLDAVNIGQTKKEIFVIENGKAVARQIELGKIIGTQIEVLSGLENGEQIIVENARNLSDGEEVRVK